MVRHDEIGDYQIEFCKEATQSVTTGTPVIGASVKAGDHTVLLLMVTYVTNSGTKDFTVTIQDWSRDALGNRQGLRARPVGD